jgi:hypothetical protein
MRFARSMEPNAWRHHELTDSGTRRAHLDRELRDGKLRRQHHGIYVVTGEDAMWRAEVEAQLLRSGPGAVVGLRTAARLHGFDGFRESKVIETITANAFHQSKHHVHRTRTLSEDDIVEIDGLRVTSIARTLFDLGRVVGPDSLEFAVEYALRGDDPGRPDIWNEDLLVELLERVRNPKSRTGASVLAVVLFRRPLGCLPTGSYAETALLQGFRAEGVDVVRQCAVRLIDADGANEHNYFTDFGAPTRLAVVEVNGKGSRGGATMTAADVTRMNLLARTLRVHVVPAAEAIAAPKATARTVRAVLLGEPERSGTVDVRGHRVRIGVDRLDIVGPERTDFAR